MNSEQIRMIQTFIGIFIGTSLGAVVTGLLLIRFEQPILFALWLFFLFIAFIYMVINAS